MAWRGFLLCLSFAVLLVGVTADTSQKTAMFIGEGECPDCRRNNSSNVAILKGLRVRVMCRSRSSHRLYRSRVHGNGEFDQHGKFTLQLPTALLKEDGSGLKLNCYAQLYSTSKKAPCPTQNHRDQFMLVLTSKDKSVHVFGTPTGKFNFSRSVCSQKNFKGLPFGFRHKGGPNPIYVSPPQQPIYVSPPQQPIYVSPPQQPIYVSTPPSPIYVPTPAAPVYTYMPPAAPVYMQPAAPVYTPPAAPVYTYMPPAAPIYTPPAAPVYTYMPPAAPIYTPPAAPIYTPPAAPVYTPPAAPVYTYTPPAAPVYATMPGIGFPFYRNVPSLPPFPFQRASKDIAAGSAKDDVAIPH